MKRLLKKEQKHDTAVRKRGQSLNSLSNSLFIIECRKISHGILYWLYAAALLMTVMQNYETAVESELGRKDDPASVFYIAENGIYADAVDSADQHAQRTMMTEATKRLIYSYRTNTYEYYPFGYIKQKKLSEKEQAAVLSYLQELTGLDEPSLTATTTVPTTETGENSLSQDIPISGGGAYILNPGQGGRFENGQFVAEPEDWEYVENASGLPQALESQKGQESPKGQGSQESQGSLQGQGSVERQGSQESQVSLQDQGSPKNPENQKGQENPSGRFEVQVTFARFQEIMDSINDLIGPNSYFSPTMLSMYYCENDMQDTPITERQHREFYEKDRVTGAFARYYCDSISLTVLCLPPHVIIDLLLKDKRSKMTALICLRTESAAKLISARLWAAVSMIMLPIFILSVKSLAALTLLCHDIGIRANLSAFTAYILAWILPTVLLTVSMALLVTVLTESHAAVLLTGLLWLFGRPSIDKIAGGNYGSFDLIIRHNTLKGYGRMMESIQTLILNRALVTITALLLAGCAVIAYDKKQKRGSHA